MRYTENYNLKKPEELDPVDIQDLNYNADAIDGKLKEIEDWEAAHLQASNPHSITPALIGAETPTGAQQKANQAETNAKSYADIVTNSALNSAKNYADAVAQQKANQAETNAKSYANIVANNALNSAKNYADAVAQQKANQAETNAKSYADIVANSTLNSAKDYADGVLESANSHTDQVASDLSQKVDETRIKVLDVEQDVSNISKVLTNLNPGQEAKQSVSGYGILSLPQNAANSPVSLVVKGNTIFNYANNGENYLNWTVTGTETTKGVNGIHLAGSTPNSNNVKLITNVKPSTQYTLIYNVKASTLSSGLAISSQSFTGATINDLSKNIGINKVLCTSAASIVNNQLLLVSPSSLSSEYIDFEVYGLLEGDYTQDNSVNKPFKYGANSTISGRIKRVGKNLWDLDNEWKIKEVVDGLTTNKINGYVDKVTMLPPANSKIPIKRNGYKENTRYTVQAKVKGSALFLRIYYTDGTDGAINWVSASFANKVGTTALGKTVRAISFSTGSDTVFAYIAEGTFQLEENIQATPYEPYTESTQYITAKDEEGKIAELRSLPNGTKDEVRLSEGKLIKRIGEKTNVASGAVINYADMADNGTYYAWNDDGETETGIKGDTLGIDATELIYQLAMPVETPVQVSGTLVSYPSGTVYIEPYVADAGIYTDKMEVLYSDLPIKALEKISKVDFDTGLETELDITAAVIAEDKLSFTHPDLTSGDIVFFVYEHGAEGTIPETEISYYDSRYVIKDSVTGKFYKWGITVANGVPSISLQEV